MSRRRGIFVGGITKPGLRWLAMLALVVGAAPLWSADWSGFVALEEYLIAPEGVGSEQSELQAYQRRLTERLNQAREEQRTQPPVVVRAQREDVAYFKAELERVVMATGGTVRLNRNEYLIKGGKVRIRTGSLLLVADRATNQVKAMAGGRRESSPLAPAPPVRPLPPGNPEANRFGFNLHRMVVELEGHACQVLVAPDLPNPYALSYTAAHEDEKDAMARVLAELPGMPMSLEYASGDVRYRWDVVAVESRAVDDGEFVLP